MSGEGRVVSCTAAFPCAICGGHRGLPKGKGIRCYGMLSSDGKFAHCTRPEYAGRLDLHKQGTTYAHRVVFECSCFKATERRKAKAKCWCASGDCWCGACRCYCGVPHGGPAPEATVRGSQDVPPDEPKPWGIPSEHVEMIHRYEVGGRLAFEICRIWEQHRSRYNGKTFPRHRGADGAFYWGAGSRWRGNPNRPLYRQDEALASLRDGSSLIIVEGERDVDALVCAGFEATCSPYGAKCFTEPQAQRVRRAMRGNPEASIRIIADNDEPGIAHALAVYERLTPTSNLRARVTAERPPGGYHDMAEAISADEDILNDW